MKYLFAVLAIVIAFSTMAIAYEPAGITYYIGGIAEANIPDIDGFVDDWAFMPRAYYWTGADFRDSALDPNGQPGAGTNYATGVTSKDDRDILALYIGWAPSTNMYYIGCDAVDNDLFFPEESIGGTWQEDHLQFLIDAPGTGGNFRTTEPKNCTAQQWYLALDPRDVATPLGFFGQVEGQEWCTVAPWAFYGMQVSATGWSCEVGMALWDFLDVAEATSTRHMLAAGDIIGGNVNIKDKDTDGENCGTTFNFADAWTDASLFAAFYLVDPVETGTPVASSTWGSIKSTFK